MPDSFGQKVIWLTQRYHWFSESSPANEAVLKVYNIDKYGNPVATTLRTYTADSFKEVIELAFELENKFLE